MLGPGDLIPEATVWTAPGKSTPLAALATEGHVLLLFYPFDWSST